VAPDGLISPTELLDEAGLIIYYTERETGKLRIVKNTKFRKIEYSADMLMYILMSRLDNEKIPYFKGKYEYAKALLEEKASWENVGYMLGSKMAAKIIEQQREIDRLNRRVERVDIDDRIIDLAKRYGLDYWSMDLFIESLEKALKGKTPPDALTEIKKIEQRVISLRERMEEYEGEKNVSNK
jgi:hypothetical protein